MHGSRSGGRRSRGSVTVGLAVLAVAVLVACSTAATAQSDRSVQEQVDAAEPGDRLRLEPGTYEETVQIDKPLAIDGGGEAVLDGGPAPAVEVTDSHVRLANLTLQSTGTPARIDGAASATLWQVDVDAPTPIRATDTPWVRAFDRVDGDRLAIEVRNGSLVRGHPVTLRILDEDGAPYPSASVQVFDGAREVVDARAGPDGELASVPVADRWSRWGPEGLRLDEGTNRTSVVVMGWQVEPALDPGVEQVDLTVVGAAEPGGIDVPTWALALGLGSATVGGAIAAAFRYHEGFRWWWLQFLAPLYTRLARSELLDHDTRAAIYTHLEDDPGTHLRQLKRELDLKHGTLLHHLQMLEDQGIIRSVKDGMYRRFYHVEDAPTGGGTPSTRERVERAILAEPGTTNQAIADALDEEPSTVHYHVDQLVDEDRVARDREGRQVRLYPSDEWAAETAP